MKLDDLVVSTDQTQLNHRTFKVMYKRTSTGEVQVWYAQQFADSYSTISGRLGGAQVISGKVLCSGKNLGKVNETTDIEQCEIEILALYVKKLKEAYHFSVEDIDKKVFFQPMLAKKWVDDFLSKGKDKKLKSQLFKYAVQTKLNGIRAILTAEGMWSRKGEPILSAPHIRKALEPFFQKYPNGILDGELYNYDLRQKLSELMSVAGKKKPTQKDLDRSAEIVQYWIYDGGLEEDELSTAYDVRFPSLANKLIGITDVGSSVQIIQTDFVNTIDEIDEIFARVTNDGEEGVMVRVLPCPYEQKRSGNLLKYKPTDDKEVTFLGVSKGSGTWADVAKTVQVRQEDGQEFSVTLKGSLEDAAWMLDNYSFFVDKEVTITYNGFTSYGVPNYGQFSLNNQKFAIPGR